MASTNNAIVSGLLEELNSKEVAVARAFNKVKEAEANYELEARKFAAIRDAAQEYIGKSPFAPDVVWPKAKPGTPMFGDNRHGFYRFINMPLAQAINEVLTEAMVPMSLEAIIPVLEAGRAAVTSARGVNAALQGLVRSRRINRLDDGEYVFNADEADAVDPDDYDLPFE